ncbi:MAG TPA: bifunctional riboflavin kinase/FAD synthetase [Enterovirga sp.]|nr:bifunctional riboflavin kinase/FAD synthetase [Enterovirga sp.]
MAPSRRSGADAPGFTICRSEDAVPEWLRGAVIAIGNFDGMHRGHRRLIELAREEAGQRGAVSAMLTFDPHPRAFFQPGALLFRLTPEPVKEKVARAFGLDAAFVLRFDAALAATSAEGFVSGLLADKLGASGLVVGDNFHFGRGRQGTPAILAELAVQAGLTCAIVPAVEIDGEVVSSSRIRAALGDGDIATANRLLGYRWFVQGEVVHGDKRGRDLGFPTANVRLDPACGLRHGIYAVRITTAPGEVREGVASFGRRPTFDDGAPVLETFVFDFAGDLYGREVEIEFVAWIRGEERFESAKTLVARMQQDAHEARELLANALEPNSLIG